MTAPALYGTYKLADKALEKYRELNNIAPPTTRQVQGEPILNDTRTIYDVQNQIDNKTAYNNMNTIFGEMPVNSPYMQRNDVNIGSTIDGKEVPVINEPRETYNPENVDILDELFPEFLGAGKSINKTLGGNWWTSFWSGFKSSIPIYSTVEQIIQEKKPGKAQTTTQGIEQMKAPPPPANSEEEAAGLKKKKKSLKTAKKNKK